MFVVCAWCKPPKMIGSKPPYEDKRETHTICISCTRKYFGKQTHPLTYGVSNGKIERDEKYNESDL